MYYVLNQELRREKDQIGRDGLEMDYSSVKCLIARKKGIRQASGVGGILLVNG